MESAWTFDIRDTVPDYDPSEENDPAIRRSYRHVNAMAFLLYAVPYRVVYGPAGAFAAALLGRLDSDPVAAERLLGPDLVDAMRGQLGQIQANPDAAGVVMRELFQKIPPAGSAGERVLASFRAIKVADRDGILCMPFIKIQSDLSGALLIAFGEMDAHISGIGNYSFFDIFTKSREEYPALAQAVAYGMEIGALSCRTWDGESEAA